MSQVVTSRRSGITNVVKALPASTALNYSTSNSSGRPFMQRTLDTNGVIVASWSPVEDVAPRKGITGVLNLGAVAEQTGSPAAHPIMQRSVDMNGQIVTHWSMAPDTRRGITGVFTLPTI